MKKTLGALLLISYSMLIAMELMEEQKPNKVEITKEMISDYRESGFKKFIETKKGEYETLITATSLPVVGNFISWGLQIGGVDTEEAKTFLGRIFEEHEEEFLDFVDKLEDDPDNMNYLKAIFDNLPEDIRVTKSREDLVKAMRQARHERVQVPKKMGEKDEQNEYTVANKDFLPFAACNLWAMHWLAEQLGSPRGLRRKNSKS